MAKGGTNLAGYIFIVVALVVIMPLYVAYKLGYSKGYMKAMKEGGK